MNNTVCFPDELNQTIRAFQESRAILTAVELDIFTAVGNGGSAEQVAAKIGTDARATGMLLNVLVNLQLLKKSADVYVNTATSSRFFREGSPDNERMAVMHTVNLWDRWSTLTECVREGTSVARRAGVQRDEAGTRAFIAAMDRNGRERAPHVVGAVGVDGVRRMVDLGGGSGAYSIAFAQAKPDLRVDIIDEPDVLKLTAEYVREAGLSVEEPHVSFANVGHQHGGNQAERVRLIPGDLLTDKYGSGYDLALSSSVCHIYGVEENKLMLRRAYDALNEDGRLVIQEFILDPDKTGPRAATLFALNMLVATEHGNTYSSDEYTEWLRGAGFREVQHVSLPGPSGLMIARK